MSTPRKKEKKEEVIEPNGPDSGIIRFEVDNVSTLDANGRYSQEVEVRGVPWRAKVRKELYRGTEYLCVDLCCMHDQSTPWVIQVPWKGRVQCSHDSTHSSIKITAGPTIFSNEGDIWGGHQQYWRDILDERKGFIREDKIAIEVRFSISDIKGINAFPRIDFTDPYEPSHDITLVIEGAKVYVNKGILSVHSPFFRAMFFGNFEERDKKEIELKNVDRAEFLEMLQLIYCMRKKIIAESAEYLLMLGDRFQIACVIDRVERFLIDTTRISDMEKLRIADMFRRSGLMNHCLSKLRTTEDFTGVKESPIYSNLSDTTKAALFERMVEATK